MIREFFDRLLEKLYIFSYIMDVEEEEEEETPRRVRISIVSNKEK